MNAQQFQRNLFEEVVIAVNQGATYGPQVNFNDKKAILRRRLEEVEIDFYQGVPFIA